MSKSKIKVGESYVSVEGEKYEIVADLADKVMDNPFTIIAVNQKDGTIEQFTDEGHFFVDTEDQPNAFDLVLKDIVPIIIAGDVMISNESEIVVVATDSAPGNKVSFSGVVLDPGKKVVGGYSIGHHSIHWSIDGFNKVGPAGTIVFTKEGSNLDTSLDEILEDIGRLAGEIAAESDGIAADIVSKLTDVSNIGMTKKEIEADAANNKERHTPVDISIERGMLMKSEMDNCVIMLTKDADSNDGTYEGVVINKGGFAKDEGYWCDTWNAMVFNVMAIDEAIVLSNGDCEDE